ncbi:MAG: trypsin-like peptidase domain-containing protein [Magnetococcales bacterium]|nr:trypsin-like peptidase domain-containing protein [Magnetococcales bacterium]MBF0116032.1 trypsin-like peptidase domain-containing protein [Magnetococcales bacterium]
MSTFATIKGVECGLAYRKYLLIVGGLAVAGLVGSYWYMNSFLDEIGVDSEKTQKVLKTARNSGQSGLQAVAEIPGTPIQSIRPGMGIAQPAAFWPGHPSGSGTVTTDRDSFATVVRSILPSVVSVSTQDRNANVAVGGGANSVQQPVAASPSGTQMGADNTLKFASPYSGVAMESIGSGVIVSSDGYIISNYHVVEKSKSIFVTVFNPQGTQRYPADIVRLDPMRDLALLKINTPLPLQAAPMGNSDLIQVGDPVITVGCPFGLDQTVSKGIVSGSRKAVAIEGVIHKDLLQTDAAINQGNSGGPLVSRYGYVVGINTAIYSPTQAFSGVGFAVPVNAVREFLAEVVTIPEVTPAMSVATVGQNQTVAGRRTTPPPIPANSVAPHGDRGTCESCHVILGGTLVRQPAFQGVPSGASGLNVALASPSATEPTVAPASVSSTVTIIGATFKAMDPVLIQRFKPPFAGGVFVQNVQEGSEAANGGMMTGDILFKLDGRWVRTPEELVGRLQGFAAGETPRLSVLREGGRKNLSLRLTSVPTVVAAPAATAGIPAVNQAGTTAGKTGAAPAAAVPTEFEWNGMELNPIDAAMVTKNPALKGKQGAVVKETDPGLPADAAGVRMNDVVVAINGLPVGSNAQLDQAIKAATTAKTILLDVERDGKRMFVTLK